MPSDANGVYSLPSGYEAVTGETIQASQHNPPLEDLATAMSARLMRTGAAPMTGAFKITDGSVGSPAIQFNSDGSTGFYKTPNGIGVSVGGTKVAEFTSSGTSRMLGELIPWTLLAAPPGWVLPYGQTLSRTTYAALWTIAQDEIAGGNTFYNNGDGSTTFGIGDLRGRVVAGFDIMGGTAANRLTTTTMSTSAIGGTGGAQTKVIGQVNLPNISLSPNITQQPSYTTDAAKVLNTQSIFYGGSSGPINVPISVGASTISLNNALAFTVPLGGSGTAIPIIQPTIAGNYILYTGV